MMEHVDFAAADFIVEYGAGTGVFTDKILSNRKADTLVMVIESNAGFCEALKLKYRNEENLIIIHGGAENIDLYMKKYGISSIDYIISGLPFASLPGHISRMILTKTKQFLKGNGKFITFQYSHFKKAYFSTFFRCLDVKWEMRNFPPAYVLTFGKKLMDGGSI
jgi:phospholipid N-methyltransferase